MLTKPQIYVEHSTQLSIRFSAPSNLGFCFFYWRQLIFSIHTKQDKFIHISKDTKYPPIKPSNFLCSILSNYKTKIKTCKLIYIPQIFRGASSSKRIGWLRKISRDFMHKPRTSASVICTILPGRHPLTENKKKVKMESAPRYSFV